MRAHSMPMRALALVLVLALAAPQLAEARYTPTQGRNAFSVEEEIKVGQQAAADVEKKLPVLPDSDPVSRYVSKLGNRLASLAPGEKWPYRFRVVNQKEINAFALPGGPIYINVGTIQAAENEAQLAGVLSHEIAHVVQRHATRAYTKQQPYAIGAGILGAILGSRGGATAQLARLGLEFGVGSYFLKNTRDAEREADLIGTDVMYDAGYDPMQMATFFNKLEAQGGARGPEFLSSHPNPGNRAALVKKEVGTLPPKSKFAKDSAEFQQIKRQVAGMKPLTAKEVAEQQKQQGSAAPGAPITPQAGDIQPSGSFRTYDHAAFSMRHPENWAASGGEQSVTIAPRSGVSEGAVAYGAIVGGASGGGELDDATQRLVQELRKGNPDLRTVGQAEAIRVNGVEGRSVDLLNVSPVQDSAGKPLRERDWLVTLERGDGSILYVIFIAPERDFDSLRQSAFEPMLRSLRVK